MKKKGMLYFENSEKKLREIKMCNTTDECIDAIREFLKDYPHFKVHYYRYWTTKSGDIIVFDVGSYTEFFKWRIPEDRNKLKNMAESRY